MALLLRNTQELISDQLKLKLLIYGPSGAGKTSFCGTAPNSVIAACETGHGNGLLTIAGSNLDYFTPNSYDEMEQFCSGVGLEKYDTVIVDGFSYLTDTLVRDKALSIPRAQGNSGKRSMGILELDDYGVLAELERRLLARLLAQPKNVIVTCLIDYYQPPQVNPPRAERMGGPELPGSMRAGSAALFDIVMRLNTRSILANPKDAKSRFTERFFMTENDGQYLAKSRLRNGTKAIFPNEVVFDIDKNLGTFDWFKTQAMNAYNSK